jgi:hypothetical protein
MALWVLISILCRRTVLLVWHAFMFHGLRLVGLFYFSFLLLSGFHFFLSTAVSRRHGTPDGDDGDNEPMWSLQLTSSWARLDAACGSHALAESEPLITTALAMLPP